jgi:tripartite-type tricarboxylate transporter receptor subunit TctC
MQKKKGIESKLLVWLCGMHALLGSLIVLPLALEAAEKWPARPITVIVHVAPGGGTDLATRALANEMSKTLGVPIVVQNVIGGGGAIASKKAFQEPPDGYTWISAGSSWKNLGPMGLHDTNLKDWYCLPLIGVYGSIAVKEDSPYKSLSDLLEALKKSPGKVTCGASEPASPWRVTLETFNKLTGLKLRYVPYTGSSPTQTALLAGETDVCITALQEQGELLKGNKIRSLGIFLDRPYSLEGYKEIPAVSDFVPELKPHSPLAFWFWFSLRADVPKPILRKIDEAFLKAIGSPSMKEFCKNYHAVTMSVVGDEAQNLIRQQAARESWLLYEVGVAKRNPADFGLPKP